MSADFISISCSNSGTTTPRSKIDSLSREDLIRFTKKQLENLKLKKAEISDLNEKLSAITNAKEIAESNLCDELNIERENVRMKDAEILRLKEECNLLTNKLENENTMHVNVEKSVDTMDLEHADTQTNENVLAELCLLKETFKQQTVNLTEISEKKEAYRIELENLRSTLEDMNEQLATFKERRNAENVLSMEIADYDKTISNLRKELKGTKGELELTKNELIASKNSLESIQNEKSNLNSNFTKLKCAIMRMKNELKERKQQIESNEKEIAELKVQLDRRNTEKSEEKLELNAIISLNEEKIVRLENTVSSLNRQLVSLRSQRESLQRQYDDLVHEHNSFKNRAAYILEQKKNDESAEENEKLKHLEEIIEQQKKTVDNLNNTNQLLQNELYLAKEQSLAINGEFNAMEKRMNIMKDAYKKELEEQKHQYELHLAANSKLNSELIAQIDSMAALQKQERQELLAKMKCELNLIEQELVHSKKELNEEKRKREEYEKLASTFHLNLSSRSSTKKESFDVEHVHRSSVAHKISDQELLEKRISESEDKDRSLRDVIFNSEPTQGVVELKSWAEASVDWETAANGLQKQVGYLQELLNEAEDNNYLLFEQIGVLKEEIRRMQRNEERVSHVGQVEYLKNVILKFLAPEKVQSERGQLIPVLATMLKLNEEEIKMLNSVVEAENENVSENVGFGNYFRRLTGM